MIQESLKNFPFIWLTCIALLLFLGLFLGMLLWIFRKDSTAFYQKIQTLPLQKEES